jgi:RNA polymerase-associated protein CTR9
MYYNTFKESSKGRSAMDDKTKQRVKEHLEQALAYYTKVLQTHPQNIYAANGVGAILAEQGKVEQAKEVFVSVQEVAAASGDLVMPDVWVNLAHIFLAQEQYNNAIKMYQNCLKKFYYNCDSQVLLYMARAYYDWDHLQECKRTLLRALHLKPTDARLRFDVALAMQEFAFRTLNRQSKAVTKKFAEVVAAVDALRLALKFFSALLTQVVRVRERERERESESLERQSWS